MSWATALQGKMGNVLLFLSWQIATCQNIRVLLVRRKRKMDFEYLLGISGTDLHDLSFIFFPVMQNKMAN